MTMNLDLTETEARILQAFLRDTLPALRHEVSRTEQRDVRHLLAEREELCERLLMELSQTLAGTRA